MTKIRSIFPRSAKTCAVVLFAAFCAAAPGVGGARAGVTAADLDFIVVRQSLAEVLSFVAASSDMRMSLSDDVSGTVRQSRLTGTPEEVLAQLDRQFDLDSFVFNGTHYVDARRNATTRIIQLGSLPYAYALEALADASLPLDRFRAEPAAGETAIVLSGPPKLLGIAEAIIDSTPPLGLAVPTIRVRRGIELFEETTVATRLTLPPGALTANRAEDTVEGEGSVGDAARNAAEIRQ